MSEINPQLVDKFVTMAKSVAATVVEVSSMEEVLKYVVDVCEKKLPCQILADEPGTPTGPLGPNGCPTRLQRIIGASQLADEDFAALKALADEKGFLLLRDGIRKYAAGIDIGVNYAMAGVAASGTCMCDTNNEDVRLCGMISEISMMILKKSDIVKDLPALAPIMRAQIGSSSEPSFTSLITGPSRTADIECVSAVGVHGPLELHILLMEG